MTKRRLLSLTGWTVLLLIIATTLVAAGITIHSSSNTEVTPQTIMQTEQNEAEVDQLAKELEQIISEDEEQRQLQSKLGDASALLNSNSNDPSELGVAVRRFDSPSGNYVIDVAAQLNQQPNTFYSVVIRNNEDRMITIGKLDYDDEVGAFTLSYAAKESIDSYPQIEIRSDKTVVMSGNFE